jgi:hypothetical protein
MSLAVARCGQRVLPASVGSVDREERTMSIATDALVGVAHVADLSGTTERRHATPTCSAKRTAPTIELRLAHATETEVVRRLAELDSTPELTGQVVIALVNGDAVAGLSLLDQRVVANPFVATREAVALLRLRAEHLAGAPTRRKSRRFLRL